MSSSFRYVITIIKPHFSAAAMVEMNPPTHNYKPKQISLHRNNKVVLYCMYLVKCYMVRFTDDSGSIKNGTQPASMYHVNEGKSKKLKPQCPGLQKVCIPKISQSHRETVYDNQNKKRIPAVIRYELTRTKLI